MGYLSQKKHRARFNFFLNAALIILTFLIFYPFVTSGESYLSFLISSYRFQYYVLTLLFMVLCLYTKFLFHMLLFTFLFLINYFSISSNANIIFSNGLSHAEDVNLLYFNDVDDINSITAFAQENNVDIIALNGIEANAAQDKTLPYYNYHNNLKSSILSRSLPIGYNKLFLTDDYEASYINLKIGQGNVILVNLDLDGIHFNDIDMALQNLGDFVLRQYNPVVIVGDFGVAPFTTPFKNFLLRTELSIKNRIILKNAESIILPPTVNILGYNNTGVESIHSFSTGLRGPAAFWFKLRIY